MAFSGPILWTPTLVQDYLAGFHVGRDLQHRLSYYSQETGGLVSEPPTAENAGPVAQTVISYIRSHEKSQVDEREALLFNLIVGHRHLHFRKPESSSLLSLETWRSERGAAFGIRHVIDVSAPSYLTSDFSVSFSGGAWALGLEEFLKISESGDADRILQRAFRQVGFPDNTPTEEDWRRDRHYLATEAQPLLPGGPKVKVSLNRHSDGREDWATTQLNFSVHGINPLGPYLPGGILELWRLAARVMAV